MTILAIDPGTSGGLAISAPDGVTAMPMPQTEGDVLDLLYRWNVRAIDAGTTRIAYIEAQAGFSPPGQRVSASAMFNYGRGYGFLLGTLMAWMWSIHLIRPQHWQKALALGSRGSGKRSAWKNKLKAEAQRRYPLLSVTLKTADALLLLDYAVRKERAS